MSITLQEKLLKLPDNLRATVQLIHSLFEEGKPLRYGDIRQARIAAGMADGSSTTIKNALQAWREIYEINPDRYESPNQIDNLVKRTIESLRDNIKHAYQQEAEIKIAAAEEETDTLRERLKGSDSALTSKINQLTELQEQLGRLEVELQKSQQKNEFLSNQNQQLTTELGHATLRLSASEDRVKQAQAEVLQREHAFDSWRDEMELQRQSQLKIIDDWQQQYKLANKTIEQLRQQLELSEKTNQSLGSQFAIETNTSRQLIQELSSKDLRIRELEQNAKSDRAALLDQISTLNQTITKLEIKLDSVQAKDSLHAEILEKLNKFDPKQLSKYFKFEKREKNGQ